VIEELRAVAKKERSSVDEMRRAVATPARMSKRSRIGLGTHHSPAQERRRTSEVALATPLLAKTTLPEYY